MGYHGMSDISVLYSMPKLELVSYDRVQKWASSTIQARAPKVGSCKTSSQPESARLNIFKLAPFANMSSTPLMKNEGRPSDDDCSDAGQIPLYHRRQQLLRKENIGWAFLFAALLALTIGLSAGVAVAVVLSWQTKGPLFSQSFAPSPVTRDLDITFHETRFDGSFMEENVYRRKANNETDAAWMALGVGCKRKCRSQERARD